MTRRSIILCVLAVIALYVVYNFLREISTSALTASTVIAFASLVLSAATLYLEEYQPVDVRVVPFHVGAASGQRQCWEMVFHNEGGRPTTATVFPLTSPSQDVEVRPSAFVDPRIHLPAHSSKAVSFEVVDAEDGDPVDSQRFPLEVVVSYVFYRGSGIAYRKTSTKLEEIWHGPE